MLVTVQRNEPGGKKEEQKKLLEHKGKKTNKKKLRGGCEVLRVWQGRAEAGVGGGGYGGVGMVQSSTASHLFILYIFFVLFFLNHSLHHTTRHCFFQTGTCRATRKLQIDHWTIVSSHDRPAERGCLSRLSRGYRKRKLDRVLRLPIFEKKKGTTLTPVCYALC